MAPALHKHNRKFQEFKPRQLPAFMPADMYDSYYEHGYFIWRDAFDQNAMESVVAALDPLEKQAEERLKAVGGRHFISRADQIIFALHLVKESLTLKNFACSPVIKGICQDLLGDHPRLYWDQAVYKLPGNPEEFPWHQDNGYTFVEPQSYLTLWIPMVDATEANGCPWVLPDRHREGTFEHKLTELGQALAIDASDAVCCEARRGDIVGFSSLTPHRTGPNLTAGIRKAYILQYVPDGAYVIDDAGHRIPQNDPERQFLL